MSAKSEEIVSCRLVSGLDKDVVSCDIQERWSALLPIDICKLGLHLHKICLFHLILSASEKHIIVK